MCCIIFHDEIWGWMDFLVGLISDLDFLFKNMCLAETRQRLEGRDYLRFQFLQFARTSRLGDGQALMSFSAWTPRLSSTLLLNYWKA